MGGRSNVIALRVRKPGAVIAHGSPPERTTQDPGVHEVVVERILFIPQGQTESDLARVAGKAGFHWLLDHGRSDVQMGVSRRVGGGRCRLPRPSDREHRKRPEEEKRDDSHVWRILSPSRRYLDLRLFLHTLYEFVKSSRRGSVHELMLLLEKNEASLHQTAPEMLLEICIFSPQSRHS